MPKDSIGSKTGSNSIKKIGHTASKNFGTSPDVQRKGSDEPRDLSIGAV